MRSAWTSPIRGETIGSFKQKRALLEPDDGTLPIPILMNSGTVPLSNTGLIINAPFSAGKLNGRNSGSRICEQGFIAMFLIDRIINNVIVVSTRGRELLVLRGRISDAILNNLNGFVDLSVLHNSPVSKIVTLQSTLKGAHGGGTCNIDIL